MTVHIPHAKYVPKQTSTTHHSHSIPQTVPHAFYNVSTVTCVGHCLHLMETSLISFCLSTAFLISFQNMQQSSSTLHQIPSSCQDLFQRANHCPSGKNNSAVERGVLCNYRAFM